MSFNGGLSGAVNTETRKCVMNVFIINAKPQSRDLNGALSWV